MAKTSIDARKHIREWSNFFADGKAVAESTIDSFLEKMKRNKYLRQSLSRLVEKGFLKAQAGKLVPTSEGIRFFRKRAKRNIELLAWDGRWRLITFDVPGGYNIARVRLRSLLKRFDFYPLQKSVWIYPDSMTKEFWKSLVEKDLEKYCKTMVVDIVEGDNEIRSHFRLSSLRR